MSDPLKPGLILDLHFTLRDEAGEVLDDSLSRGQPLSVLLGAGMLHKGVEEAVIGRHVGDTFTVVVPPEKGYGIRRGGAQPVPRAALPGDEALTPGHAFVVRTPDGRPMMLWVEKIVGDQVWVDPHHPLAGRTLTWDLTLLSARPALPEELRQGRPLDA
jgi:FKBP-type peptidyl-prolyl cis-trans isomerase SlyD